MEIAALPHDQFSLEYENQKRMQFTATNSELSRSHMFNTQVPLNQFPPVSYGILPSPCNHLQFPSVNNLQFMHMHGSNLHFPCGNNSQICSVNGVRASPVSGFQKRPFSCPSPEWEKPQDNVVFGLPQPPLFGYHPAPALHPQITISEAMHVGRRWHSMPEGCDSGKGAPLFRSRTANIPSPQIGNLKHDKRSPKPIFEWKLVDSGPPNEGSFGAGKQSFTAAASHRQTKQKRNTAKKTMNGVKSGGGKKKKNMRDTCSSGLTFKRSPKSEEVQAGVNNLIQALGQCAITKTDLVHASNAPYQTRTENTGNDVSEESSKLEAAIDHNERQKLLDDCETNEIIVFKLEKESEQNSAPIAPDSHSKESNQTAQVGHKVLLEATDNSLDTIVGGMGVEVCAVSPCLYTTEKWAGPAYTNSPPPTSLPLPRFSMRGGLCMFP